MVRYLIGNAWTAWETPTVSEGKVTKLVTLSSTSASTLSVTQHRVKRRPRKPKPPKNAGTSGLCPVYVQLMETTGSANPGAMTDPKFTSIILDTVPPQAFIQMNQGATSLSRFNTNLNYLILNILATDSASGVNKIALFQTGTLASTTVPPPANSP